MDMNSDWIIDRRRLKHRLALWRCLAIAAVVVSIAALVRHRVEQEYVARVVVDGIITDSPGRDELLADIGKDDRVRAVLVRIDSPGGTVVGGERLYRDLRALAEAKPVVAVLGETATSAAYMAALGSDRIVASAGTLTGSIGVLLQSANVTELLDKLGIKPEIIKSSPLKAQPNPFETFTPQAREATRAVIEDIYHMFVDLVRERRALSKEQVEAVADGRVFTGRQAKELGLVDAIGGEADALSWLHETRGVSLKVPVKDADDSGGERKVMDLISEHLGKIELFKALSLDGLISVWQPNG